MIHPDPFLVFTDAETGELICLNMLILELMILRPGKLDSGDPCTFMAFKSDEMTIAVLVSELPREVYGRIIEHHKACEAAFEADELRKKANAPSDETVH